MLLPDFILFSLLRAVQAAAESLAAVGPEARCESKEFIAYSTLEEPTACSQAQIALKLQVHYFMDVSPKIG